MIRSISLVGLPYSNNGGAKRSHPIQLTISNRAITMIKPRDPRELAEDLLPRSICSVMVAAVLADDFGIFSWGWNHVGAGYGEHAEHHAIRRSNRIRLERATIYVTAQRRRNGKPVIAKPCEECMKLIDKYKLSVEYRDSDGEWKA